MSVIENITALHSIVQLAIDAQNFYKCSICLETIRDGVRIDCRHKFCYKCLREHETINSKNHKTLCPICKRTIKRRKKYVDSYMMALVTFIDELNGKLQSEFNTGIMGLSSLKLIERVVQEKNTLEQTQLDKNKLFDSLLQNTRRSSIKKVYGASKKSKIMSKYQPLDVLPFENEENKNYVLQWLNDNKNTFDNITQTQSDVQNTDKSVGSDIESVSEIDTKTLTYRSRSLECLSKDRPNPISRSQSLEKIEEFSSDDNFIIPNTSEKLAIVNLFENEFLRTVENEVVTNKDSKKAEGKKNPRKKILSSGWERMKEMKKMMRKCDRRPKPLNITTRRQSCSTSDKKITCTEPKVILVDLYDKKKEFKINTPKKNKKKKLNGPKTNSKSSVSHTNKTAKNITLSGETSSSINCEPKIELVVAQIHECGKKKNKNVSETNLHNNKKTFRKRTLSQIEEENKIVVDANSMEDYFEKNMYYIAKDGNDSDASSKLSQGKDDSSVNHKMTPSPNAKKHMKSQNGISDVNKNNSQNSNKIEILSNKNDSTKKNDVNESDDDDEIFSKPTQKIHDKNESKTSDTLKVLTTGDLLNFKNQDEIVITINKLKKLLLQNNINYTDSETTVVKQDQAIQTEVNYPTRGICVSSNEIFVTIDKNEVEVQTYTFTCPNCKNTIENEIDSNIREEIIPNKILTDSFDNVQFETQNLIKRLEKSHSKVADICEANANVSNTHSLSETKDTTALVIDFNSQSKSQKSTSRQLDFPERNFKPNYKRIRTVSDSESDSEKPYNVKKICSKYLRNKLQVSLQFETETMQHDEIKNEESHPKTESQEMYEKCMKALLNAEKHSNTNKELDIGKKKETVFSLDVMQEFENKGFTCEHTNENPATDNNAEDIMEDVDENIFADASFEEFIKGDADKSSKTKIESNLCALSGKNKRKLCESENVEDANVSLNINILMDGVQPLSPKVKILQNITVKDFDEDKENINKTQESDDIIEATPEKKSTSFKKKSLQNKTNVPISNADNEKDESLNITLPPPVEFQDDDFTESKIFTLPDTNDMDITICNKIEPAVHTSSQILSYNAPDLPFSQTLSPIAQEKQKQVLSSKMNDKIEFSPLTIVRKTPSSQRNSPMNTSTPRQKSILNYTQSPAIKKPCVACTRLNKEQTIAVLSLKSKKLIDYSTDFNPSVTHMIVNVNDYNRNCVKDHTLKFVLAVASGIWVLNFKWIQDCIKQKRIVPEESYEVLDVSGLPGPKESRLNRLKKPLFHNFKVLAAPPFQCTTKHEMETIITSLGGKTVQNVEDFKSKKISEICLIVTEARYTQDFENYEKWLETFGVLTVDVEWVSRSVGQYKLLSLLPFCLCSDDLSGLNYPPELLTDVPFSFSQSTYSTA